MIAVLYIMKRKIKKIFFEVISNSKIFNISFFQRNCQRPRFCQTYKGGLDKEGLDNVECGNIYSIKEVAQDSQLSMSLSTLSM